MSTPIEELTAREQAESQKHKVLPVPTAPVAPVQAASVAVPVVPTPTAVITINVWTY